MAQSLLADSHPLMIAWKAHQATPEYANSKHWAEKPEHLEGSLWALFEAGYLAGASNAAPVGAKQSYAEPTDSCADGGDTGNAEADRIIDRLMSSDPDFSDCSDAALLIRKLVVEHRGPDGFATWKDAAIHERQLRTSNAAPPQPALRDKWHVLATPPAPPHVEPSAAESDVYRIKTVLQNWNVVQGDTQLLGLAVDIAIALQQPRTATEARMVELARIITTSVHMRDAQGAPAQLAALVIETIWGGK